MPQPLRGGSGSMGGMCSLLVVGGSAFALRGLRLACSASSSSCCGLACGRGRFLRWLYSVTRLRTVFDGTSARELSGSRVIGLHGIWPTALRSRCFWIASRSYCGGPQAQSGRAAARASGGGGAADREAIARDHGVDQQLE